jgi:hypothetical protein
MPKAKGFGRTKKEAFGNAIQDARTQGALRGAFLVDIGNTRVSPQRDGRFKAVTNYRLVFQTRKRRKK